MCHRIRSLPSSNRYVRPLLRSPPPSRHLCLVVAHGLHGIRVCWHPLTQLSASYPATHACYCSSCFLGWHARHTTIHCHNSAGVFLSSRITACHLTRHPLALVVPRYLKIHAERSSALATVASLRDQLASAAVIAQSSSIADPINPNNPRQGPSVHTRVAHTHTHSLCSLSLSLSRPRYLSVWCSLSRGGGPLL